VRVSATPLEREIGSAEALSATFDEPNAAARSVHRLLLLTSRLESRLRQLDDDIASRPVFVTATR